MAKTKFLTDMTRQQNLYFIALVETGKKDFTQTTFNGLCGGKKFLWHWTEPHGMSGGILLGVNLDVLDIGSIHECDFYVQLRLRNKTDNF